ncbi:MAG: hypothetical protein QN195_08080 [Armatimonadota bacterium]|nr:hypothetical protein [Armatimonadota bacterium]MDR7448163.1 hypothetical protein [Armatimonadota bacterium]MDR7458902.1 hypothetical protein [Armatimonadota bacterium]MDR7479189.1 hypothetical protein [Armatimonadota bacterium]MDR7487599.1 hypothetical protein [Armatimonadota bacterium]
MSSGVRRIRGLNLRVTNLRRSVEFYTETLHLQVEGSFGREAFLRWSDGEDFLGLFARQTAGLHHIELRLFAPNADTALADLAQRRLLPFVRKLGSTSMAPQVLKRRFAEDVEVVRPLLETPLFVEVSDPDGRSIELVYLYPDRTVRETPGLLEIEVASSRPDRLKLFYQQVGFGVCDDVLVAASGQRLRLRPGERPEYVRATVVVSAAVIEGLSAVNTLEGTLARVRDPDGHEWLLYSA